MRNVVLQSELDSRVGNVMDELMDSQRCFTYYDVTLKLRKDYPDDEIVHDSVRVAVDNYISIFPIDRYFTKLQRPDGKIVTSIIFANNRDDIKNHPLYYEKKKQNTVFYSVTQNKRLNISPKFLDDSIKGVDERFPIEIHSKKGNIMIIRKGKDTEGRIRLNWTTDLKHCRNEDFDISIEDGLFSPEKVITVKEL